MTCGETHPDADVYCGPGNQHGFTHPAQRSELIWAAIDYDGTLTHSKPPEWIPGPPLPGVRAKLMELFEAGYKINIHTARPSSDYELIEMWMLHYGLPFHRITTGKLLAAFYIDDRNGPHVNAVSWLPEGEARGEKESTGSPRAASSNETQAQPGDDEASWGGCSDSWPNL